MAICSLTSAQSLINELDKVKEIKLLESTKDDVGMVLADYNLDISDNPRYYQWFSNKNAHIKISYSRGDCSENSEDWNVPEWKVTKITIAPKTSIKIKDVGIDYSKFRKEVFYINEDRAYVYHKKDLGIAFEVYKNDVQKIYLFPSKKDYSLLCDKERIRKYYSSQKWFVDSESKKRIVHYNASPAVTNLILSATEIIARCDLSASVRHIAIFTTANDPDNDPLIYDYKVSEGKIIGQGSNVVWDLSNVQAGTFTITASVDDGCGDCGKSMTKTVVVKECPMPNELKRSHL